MNPELVIQPNGEVRQAGAVQSGPLIKAFKEAAQKHLYVFGKGVLSLDRLTTTLHKPICDWLGSFPPYRKMLIIPRDHLKTSIAKSFIIHTLIQDKGSNPYVPNLAGVDTRILIACESATNAEHSLRWIEQQWTTNQLLRALWPQCAWPNPNRDSPAWNAKEMTLPRKTPYNESTVETIGVGGAIASRHYNILFKDDLISKAAADSPIVMEDTWTWHTASRALFDDPEKSLELITGTYWAPGDIWQRIHDGDVTVESVVRAIVEDGRPIFPELFPMRVIEQLKRPASEGGMGPLFWLNMMNTPINPDLTDFDPGALKYYRLSSEGQLVLSAQDASDLADDLQQLLNPLPLPTPTPTITFAAGTRMTPQVMRELMTNGTRLRTA